MKNLRLAMTDDIEMHRGMLRMALAAFCRAHDDLAIDIVRECEHGADLLNGLDPAAVDVLTLDIRMPEMDGLTALLHLRRQVKFSGIIIMVSSEEESNVDRFFKEAVSDKVRSMPIEQKFANMAKVEERILSGQKEEGKINDLLTGCEKLRLDPIAYARHLGANGFLHKPYKPEQVEELLTGLLLGGSTRAFTSTR